MDHIAIMNPMQRPGSREAGMIEKILSGEKTIESRWLKQHVAPWNMVTAGDTIYFKYAGAPIVAKAIVLSVEQIDAIDDALLEHRLPSLAPDIGLDIDVLKSLVQTKHCGMLMHIDHASPVTPFAIDKSDFGAMAAWITVDSIDRIRV